MFTVLLILIFIRPFISSLAFPYLNLIYASFLIGFLAIWFLSGGMPLKEIKPIKYPIILFCLSLIISIAFSQSRFNSLGELYKYISGLLLFLIIGSLINENKIRVIRIAVLAGFIISILAIYQYFFGFRHILNYMNKVKITDAFALDYIMRKRVFFPFVTPNILAGYLIIVIPLTLIIKGNKKWGILLPVSFGLLLTKSLGAFLTIFLTSVIYFYLQGKLEKRRILFLAGLLVIIGLVFITRAVTQKQHLSPIFSTIMRLNYWRDTLIIIKASPLTGVGPGNFNLTQSRYAHNSYLQIWAEMGIIGLISFLWLLANAIKISLKKFKQSHNYIYGGVFLSLLAFGLHNIVDFSFFLPEVNFLFWISLGLIFSKSFD